MKSKVPPSNRINVFISIICHLEKNNKNLISYVQEMSVISHFYSSLLVIKYPIINIIKDTNN